MECSDDDIDADATLARDDVIEDLESAKTFVFTHLPRYLVIEINSNQYHQRRRVHVIANFFH